MNIVIVSLSRCGSTKLFYQLLRCFPESTAGYFEPSCLNKRLFNHETGLIAKVVIDSRYNRVSADQLSLFTKTLFVVRDPRDRLVSSLLFALHGDSREVVDRRIAILQEKEADPGSVSFINLVERLHPDFSVPSFFRQLSDSYQMLDDLIDGVPTGRVFRYEDLIRRRYDSLKNYVGEPATTRFSDNVVLPERHDYGLRSATIGDWKNWLTREDIPTLKEIFDPVIRKYRYSAEWTIDPLPSIHPQFASEFVRKAFLRNRRLQKQGYQWRDR